VTTTKDSQSQVVVSSVLYQPFGGVKGYTLGNGQVYSRGIDLDGRIASYTLGAQSFGIGYDAASRIQFISDFANSANTNNYAYDTRGRLVQAVSSLGTTSYQVTALGQRIRKTNSLGDTEFHYDTRGHLIAETDAAGGVKRELIYLGDIPVGVVQ